MVDFKIIFLGTSSALPTKDRGLSSTVIRHGNQTLVFDAGEGAQRAAMNAGIGLTREFSIFITHLHGDHVVGLLGLLQTMAMFRRERDLHIYGPKGIVEFVFLNQKVLNFGVTYHMNTHVVKQGVIYDRKDSKYKILAERSEHSNLSYAYLFEEKEKPGTFNPKEALRLGVPEGPLWSLLQKGKKVKSPLKKKYVYPRQVLGPPRKGLKIGISGDTRPSKKLEKFFRGADVIIFDSTYSDQHEKNAKENMHSTSREAAKLAKRAGAKQLILTHFSSRYKNVGTLVKQAREVFPNTIAASDLMVYDMVQSSA
ncbi:MAG: ribonuclease Z [Nitrososphaerales archaeon]